MGIVDNQVLLEDNQNAENILRLPGRVQGVIYSCLTNTYRGNHYIRAAASFAVLRGGGVICFRGATRLMPRRDGFAVEGVCQGDKFSPPNKNLSLRHSPAAAKPPSAA
ncbi:hypothetical protein Bbelb_306960 [Branchiostoma belcheri]|nr:hypothetical protein Bbelb_306960 [Branchiostoma belcheri]